MPNKNKSGKKKSKEKKDPWRPTKWEPEFNDRIVAYFDHEDSYHIEHDEKGRPYPVPVRLPTFEKFARSIHVTHATLLNWAKESHDDPKKYPGFFEAYTRAQELQESFLLTAGFAGASQSNMTIFILKNKYNYRDTHDHTNAGEKFEQPVIINPGGPMWDESEL